MRKATLSQAPDERLLIGVLADLAADADGGRPDPPAWVALQHGGVDAFMAAAAPRLVCRVADTLREEGELAVDLHFATLRDFSPEHVRNSLPQLHTLQQQRDQMAALRSLLLRDPLAEAPAELAPFDPRVDHGAAAPAPAAPVDGAHADSAHDGADGTGAGAPAGHGRPAGGSFQTQVSSAGAWSSRAPRQAPPDRAAAPAPRTSAADLVRTFAAEAIAAAQPRPDGRDPLPVLQQRIDAFDRKIADQLAAVLQAPGWRALHAAWHGLEGLLSALRACPRVALRVMAVRRADLPRQLDRHDPGGAWQRLAALARAPAGPAPRCLMLVARAHGDGADGDADADADAASAVWRRAADLAHGFQRSGQLPEPGTLTGAVVDGPHPP